MRQFYTQHLSNRPTYPGAAEQRCNIQCKLVTYTQPGTGNRQIYNVETRIYIRDRPSYRVNIVIIRQQFAVHTQVIYRGYIKYLCVLQDICFQYLSCLDKVCSSRNRMPLQCNWVKWPFSGRNGCMITMKTDIESIEKEEHRKRYVVRHLCETLNSRRCTVTTITKPPSHCIHKIYV